jgi:catechol 2,3-dioxygenase-like lactoylglutathione lyase family enzyme
LFKFEEEETMKRFHVHIVVDSLEQSMGFYSRLFGQEPSVVKPDYAKWMLDDPRVNFAISKRDGRVGQAGLDHLGFQMDSTNELHAMTAQLQSAGLTVMDQGETTCCYAKSDKGWVHDPQGIAWENFVTLGEATTYGVETIGDSAHDAAPPAAGNACCAPSAANQTSKPKISLKNIAIAPMSVAAASCGSPSSAGSSCC